MIQQSDVIHSLLRHLRGEQPVGRHHDARVARLHRDDHLVELPVAADAQKFHCRDDHPFGRIAVAVEDPPGERAVVDTDAQRHAAAAALLDEGLQFAVAGAVVARIDAHFIDVFGRDRGHLGDEVDVGHNGRAEAVGAQPLDDVSEVLAFAATLGREADDRTAGPGDALDLRDGTLRIEGRSVGHRLHGDGLAAADLDRTDADAGARASGVTGNIHS